MSEIERDIQIYGWETCNDCRAVRLILRSLKLPREINSSRKTNPEDEPDRRYALRIGRALGREAFPVVVISYTDGKTRSHVMFVEARGPMLESFSRVLTPDKAPRVLTRSQEVATVNPELTVYGRGNSDNNPAIRMISELELPATYFDINHHPDARRTRDRICASVDNRAGYVMVLSDIYPGQEATATSPDIPARNCRMAFVNPKGAIVEEAMYAALLPYANR